MSSNLALPLTSRVTLSWLLNLSEPWNFHLCDGTIVSDHMTQNIIRYLLNAYPPFLS